MQITQCQERESRGLESVQTPEALGTRYLGLCVVLSVCDFTPAVSATGMVYLQVCGVKKASTSF